MQSIGDVLKNFNPTKDKYISREFQSFGVHLSEVLEDPKHKSLYIKMAKTINRAILEKALSFVIDSKASNKGALFMWKVTELKKSFKSQAVKKISDVKKRISEEEKVNPNFKTKKVKVEQDRLL
ncbi:MAG TPA: hypothetical protein VF189_05975 [Patescibacteria group bacterium]